MLIAWSDNESQAGYEFQAIPLKRACALKKGYFLHQRGSNKAISSFWEPFDAISGFNLK
jgi:hypothetical protein